MTREIVVRVRDKEHRLAVRENGQVLDLYIERQVNKRIVGNIYLGRVQNVLPGMQAAFVDIGMDKNAFLYVSDAIGEEEKYDGDEQPAIEDVLQSGQEIMVQVTKEAIGAKGPRLTTHITLPGRYFVLMPAATYIGVSRRITENSERERLKDIAENLRDDECGLIVRTAANNKEEEELKGDLDFLCRLWHQVKQRKKEAQAPALIYNDLNLIRRIVRDLFTDDVDRFVIDSREEFRGVKDLLDYISPQLKKRVIYYKGESDIFEHYGIDKEIERALKRRVWLKSGGYIVIDETEALTVIDVNTGKYVGEKNLEDTVLKTNLEAAREIARQLRLRDIGGIIVIDFIDMETRKHQKRVITVLERALEQDKTHSSVLGLTNLGLVEMTRKKVRENLDEVLEKECIYCEGTGKTLSEETVAIQTEEEILKVAENTEEEAMLLKMHPSVAAVLIGGGGANLEYLEEATDKAIYIRGSEEYHIEETEIVIIGSRREVEKHALPVSAGDEIRLRIEEPHVSNPQNGIGRIEGYVIDVHQAGDRVGEWLRVRIQETHRTYARAERID